MNISDFRVEPADYRVDFEDLRAVRETVFIIEQGIPENIEFDAVDPECHHVVARDNNHHPIGTARLSPEGKIGRMAVLADWRDKGVGKALLTALLDKARKLGLLEISLNAQETAIAFYAAFGFTPEGGSFMEAEIPHQVMRLRLEPLEESTRPIRSPRPENVEIASISSLDSTLSATLTLIGKARRQLCIYSLDLEPLIYGQKETIEALKDFAIQSNGGSIMIILQDVLAVRGQSHPLIDLAQRLPSIFSLRTPVEAEDMQYPSAFVINDREGYLFRQQGSQYKGVWSPVMPSRNRQLQEDFDSMWQRCRVCSEFRALNL